MPTMPHVGLLPCLTQCLQNEVTSVLSSHSLQASMAWFCSAQASDNLRG